MNEYRSEDIADLAERLESAAEELYALAKKTNSLSAHARLLAKRQGVILALDYLRTYEIR